MIIIQVKNPYRVAELLESNPNDPKKMLIEKIKKLAIEINSECHRAEKHIFKVSHEEGLQTYRLIRAQVELIEQLVEQYYTPVPGDIDVPKNVIEVEYLRRLLQPVKFALNFIGSEQRRKRKLKGKLFCLESSKFIPSMATLTFDKDGHLFRYVLQPGKNFKGNLCHTVMAHVKNEVGLPAIFANLNYEPGWHSLFPSGSGDITYHVVYSPQEMLDLVRQEKFAQLEEYIVVEEERHRNPRLQHVFSNFTPQERNRLFQKAKQHVNVGLALMEMLDYTDSHTLQSALRFGLDIYHRCNELHHLLKKYFFCKIENPKPTDMLWFVRMGAVVQIKQLIDEGFTLDVKQTVYHESFGTQRRCVNSALLHYIRETDPSSDICEFITWLTGHGLDLNTPAEVDSERVLPLEYLVFHFEDDKDYHRLVKTYLECGAKPTPEVQRFWLARAHQPKFRYYIDFLKSKNYIPEEEYNVLINPQKRKAEDIDPRLAIEYRSYLEKMQKLAHLNRSMLDLNKMSEIKCYKKKLKKMTLKNPHRLCGIYKSFSEAYNKVVQNHVLLNELREISRDLRQQIKLESSKRNFAHRTVSFIAAWEYAIDTENTRIKLKSFLPSEGAAIFNRCYNRVMDAAERLKKDKYLSRHNITWLHGTKSSSLPCILKLKQILSMGDLLDQDIVTFSGEHCGSDRDADHKINKEHVSGEKPSATWDDGVGALYYSAPTRTMLTRYYSENVHNATNTLNFDINEAIERISITHVAQLYQVRQFYRRHGVFVRMRFDVLRLRTIGAKVEDQLMKLKAYLETKLKDLKDENDISDTQLILDAITKPLTLTFDKEDLELMIDPHPYGIVFGSTKIDSTPYKTEQFKDPLEFLVKSPVHFKKDIQVAFTKKEKVADLQKKLKPFGIRVYDFEMAMVQELITMAINGSCQEYDASLKFIDPLVNNQLSLAHEMQVRVLPEYATLYPENPSYKDGSKVYIEERGCEEYRKSVQEGQSVARLIHGPMHSCRGAIWALVLHRLEEADKQIPICNVRNLQFAFSYHDIMRQNEGKDHWDKSSARFYLTQRIVENKTIPNFKKLADALAFKDPENRQFIGSFHEVIHDADVIEIFPRALANIDEFRVNELCFFENLRNVSREVKEELIAEMFAFNTFTNNPKLHLYMETSVENYYAELMRLLKYYHGQEGNLPIIYHLINKEIEAFSDRPLDPKILELVDVGQSLAK